MGSVRHEGRRRIARKLWLLFRRRAALAASVITQLLAGLASIILTIAVARSQTPEELGLFAVTLALQGLIAGLGRSYTSDVYLFSHETYGAETARSVVKGSTSAALCIGASCSFVSIILAFISYQVAPSVQVFTVALGVSALLIPTLMQQHLRIALVASGKHYSAVLLDAFALAVVVVGSIVVSKLSPMVLNYFMVWAMSSALFALGALLTFRLVPSPADGYTWLRVRAKAGTTFATDFAVTAGLTQFVVLFVSAVSGLGAAGALRGAQTLVMPVTLVMRGTGGPLASALVKKMARNEHLSALHLCVTFSSFCLLSSLACGVWLVLPDRYLILLLGESALPAKGVLLPTAFALGATGIASGAGYYLRANGELRVATLLKILSFPVSLGGVVYGSFAGSAAGAQLGLMFGELIRSILAWGSVRRRFRRRL